MVVEGGEGEAGLQREAGAGAPGRHTGPQEDREGQEGLRQAAAGVNRGRQVREVS